MRGGCGDGGTQAGGLEWLEGHRQLEGVFEVPNAPEARSA